MKRIIVCFIAVFFTGCATIPKDRSINDLTIAGNPYIRCVDHGVETRGIFVCKKEQNSNVIAPCRAVPHTEGWIVLNSDGTGQFKSFDPIFVQCYLITGGN